MNAIEPSALRKYLYEYAVIALAGCVVYLFLQINTLNSYIRTELTNTKNEAIKTIYQNSVLLERLINKQDKP